MNRILLIAVIVIAASSLALGQKPDKTADKSKPMGEKVAGQVKQSIVRIRKHISDGSSSASGQVKQGTAPYICSEIAGTAPGKTVAYLTDVFQVPQKYYADGSIAQDNRTPVLIAWTNYLYGARGAHGTAECHMVRVGETYDSYSAQIKANMNNMKFTGVTEIVHVDWKYTPDVDVPTPTVPAIECHGSACGPSEVSPKGAGRPQNGRPVSQMSAVVQRLIDDEAKSTAGNCKEQNIGARVYNQQKIPSAPPKPIYDCSCYSRKVREYRLKEYEQRGEEMLAKGHIWSLEPALGYVLMQVDFKSCAVANGASSPEPDVAQVAPATAAAAPQPGPPPSAASATTPAAKASEIVAYCLTPVSAQNVIYYSPIVQSATTTTEADLASSFAAFLLKKYAYRTSVSCSDSRNYSPHEVQYYAASRQQKIADYRSGGYTVVETDWTYTPVTRTSGSPTPPAANGRVRPPQLTPSAKSSVPQPPPQTPYAVCWTIGDQRTTHFSAPFVSTNKEYRAWEAGFRSFMKNNYNRTVGIRCVSSGSLTQARTLLHTQEDALRRTGHQVIDTNWKYD